MAAEKLNKNGFEEYPMYLVIGQNLFFLIYFGIAFTGMWDLRFMGFPLISLAYAVFLVLMLIFILRKHLCTNCYYYGKRCSTGWGKLSALMFKKNSGNYELGVKLAGMTWAVAIITPIIGISAGLIMEFKLPSMLLLISFIILTPVNLGIHRYSCMKCKIRNVCPASMVKKTQ